MITTMIIMLISYCMDHIYILDYLYKIKCYLKQSLLAPWSSNGKSKGFFQLFIKKKAEVRIKKIEHN